MLYCNAYTISCNNLTVSNFSIPWYEVTEGYIIAAMTRDVNLQMSSRSLFILSLKKKILISLKLYLPYKQIEITGWFLQENVLFSKIFLIIKIVCQMKEFLENIFFLISHSYSNYSVGLELQDWQSKNKTRTNKWWFYFIFFCDFDIF